MPRRLRWLNFTLLMALLCNVLARASAAPPTPGVLPSEPDGQWRVRVPIALKSEAPAYTVPSPDWRVLSFQLPETRWYAEKGGFTYRWWNIDPSKQEGLLEFYEGIDTAELDEEDVIPTGGVPVIEDNGKTYVMVPARGLDGKPLDRDVLAKAIAEAKDQPMSELHEVQPGEVQPQFAGALVLLACPPLATVVGVVLLGTVVVWAIYEMSQYVQDHEFQVTRWQDLSPSAPNAVVPFPYPWDAVDLVNLTGSDWTAEELASGAPAQAEYENERYFASPKPEWWGRVKKDGPVRVPKPKEGIPEPPDHVLDHPRDAKAGYEHTSQVKTAAWIHTWNALANGEPPDGCFENYTQDGRLNARMVVYLSRYILFQGGTRLRGVAVVVNHLGSGPDTAIANVYRGKHNRITSSWNPPGGGKPKNIFRAFREKDPCPPNPGDWLLGY